MHGIGVRLKQLRKENNMTLDELGVKLNMPKSSLSRYENEESDPSIETVKKIAQFYGVTIDWLAGISEEREPSYLDEQFINLMEECKKNNLSADKVIRLIKLLKEE